MTYKKKLIEVALPLEDINREAARAKRKAPAGYPTTLHRWWAQRPIAACRAVLFASLVDDPSEHTQELLADAAKRRAAETVFKARKKEWQERKALFEKAREAGMTSVPDPGSAPALEEIAAEQDRERLFEIIRELVKWENSNNEQVLNAARAEIMRSCNGKPPPVYDPFCGGGSIPLEAQRLGLEAHASDLNPVPVLITKALIEIPPKFAGKPPVNPESRKKLGASGSWKGAAGLAEDIRYYGEWMRDEAEKRIGHLYPKVKLPKEHGGGEATAVAWLWARSVECPNPSCRAQMPLMRSFWLATKTGAKSWLEPSVTGSSRTIAFRVRCGEPDSVTKASIGSGTCVVTGAGKRAKAAFRCPICSTGIAKGEYIDAQAELSRVGMMPLAVVVEKDRRRLYLPVDEVVLKSAISTADEIICSKELADFLPQEPTRGTFASNAQGRTYGFKRFRDYFTPRQLAAVAVFSKLIPATIERILKDALTVPTASSAKAREYAASIGAYLAFAVSRHADYGNSLCSWRPKDNAMRCAFSKQAVQMVWDFAEGSPFGPSSSGFLPCIKVVARVVEMLPVAKCGGSVVMCDAASNPIEGAVYATDPPYYDNVSYADLADFFYVWLRRSLGAVFPELFSTLLVPKEQELVASKYRHASKEVGAKAFFEEGLAGVFETLRKCANPNYPFTLFYAFRQSESEDDADDGEVMDHATSEPLVNTGWETMLNAINRSGFCIDGTWPMRTEGDNRQVGINANALASSIVLVCRPRPKDASVASRRDFLATLKRELPEALRNLQKGNIAPVDLAQAAIGPGMAVFSRYAKVLEADGMPMSVRTALSLINQSLDEVLAEQEGEFDADTRWALAWFDQNGFSEGAYGVAETLCTAKNTSVSGMVEAGILSAKGGKVRLLKKEELDADWNPATDKRLTIWEITHHLIRRLEQGESGAAELIHQLGAKAEVARDLSYRLYTICERRKWSQDAIAYNALVLSWGDVQRLAEETKTVTPTQGELI